MGKTIVIPDNRTGFSMKVEGIQLNRPDLHNIAADIGIEPKDILFTNGILTIYNTSEECQEIVNDNALAVFVAMTLEISADRISEMTAVEAEDDVIEMDDFNEDEDED
jgi:hypothetical protein